MKTKENIYKSKGNRILDCNRIYKSEYKKNYNKIYSKLSKILYNNFNIILDNKKGDVELIYDHDKDKLHICQNKQIKIEETVIPDEKLVYNLSKLGISAVVGEPITTIVTNEDFYLIKTIQPKDLNKNILNSLGFKKIGKPKLEAKIRREKEIKGVA